MDNEKGSKINIVRTVKINMGNYENQEISVNLTTNIDEVDNDSIKKELLRVTNLVEEHLASIMEDNGLDFISNLGE